MNKNVKKLWLEALRSGKYEQGQIYLNKGGKLCCLGVLCEVARAQGVPLEIEEDEDSTGISFVSYDGDSCGIPEAVQDWSGLEGSLPRVDELVDGTTSLSMLNDGCGYSFLKIADIIEQQL